MIQYRIIIRKRHRFLLYSMLSSLRNAGSSIGFETRPLTAGDLFESLTSDPANKTTFLNCMNIYGPCTEP